MTAGKRRALGLLSLAFYVVHVGLSVRAEGAAQALWACHVAALLAGVGLLVPWPAVNGVGLLWYCMGTPLWLVDLASGGSCLPTTLLTHVGSFLIAGYGVRVLGMPRQVWWKAILGFLALQQLCRWVTEPEPNINLAHRAYPGWETTFPSYWVYMTLLLGMSSVVFFVAERAARRWLVTPAVVAVAKRGSS